MKRTLVAPAVWLMAGVSLGTWAWLGPKVLEGPGRTTGLLPYLLACAVTAVAVFWLARRLRPARVAAAAGIAFAVAAVAVAVPWGLAGQQERSDVVWSGAQGRADARVVGDRLYQVLDDDDPARLQVRDLPTGKLRWSRDLPGTITSGGQVAAVSDDGDVLVSGRASDSADSIVRFDAQGRQQWSRSGSLVVAATPNTTVLQDCDRGNCRLQGVDGGGATRWSTTYVPDPAVERRAGRGMGPGAPAPSVVALVEPNATDTGNTVALLDADTGRRRQQVRTGPAGAAVALARGRSVMALSSVHGSCRWQVLQDSRVQRVDLPGSCVTTTLRELAPDQLFAGALYPQSEPTAWILDIPASRATTVPHAQGRLTSPEVAIDVVGSDRAAVDPVTGSRLWSVADRQPGQEWFLAGAVARVWTERDGALNPFLRRHSGRSPRAVELLSARTGMRLAATVCHDRVGVESVGDDWALVTCGDELRLVTASS